jgi:hypothetical protein
MPEEASRPAAGEAHSLADATAGPKVRQSATKTKLRSKRISPSFPKGGLHRATIGRADDLRGDMVPRFGKGIPGEREAACFRRRRSA